METQKPDNFDYLKHLRWLNSFETGLGKPIMHSNDSTPPPHYRVRKAWFTSVGGDLQGLIDEEKIIDPKLIEEINAFQIYMESPEFSHSKPTTKEEIDMANSLIEKVIQNL